MGAETPHAGSGSGEADRPASRVQCPGCGDVLAFSGAPPRFCSSCGRPLAREAEADTLATAAGPAELPTLAPPAAGRPPADLRVVGGYRLVRRLGGGGMGAVFEAEDPAGRRVALKLIAPGQELSADAVERFRREGRLASGLSHPRCVFVYAADEDAGRPFIVMELMPGRTLADLVRERGFLPPAEAVAKALDVLDGLREAHRLGVVHRDVKPSNCFLEADGRVKVGDFGLSKSLAGDVRLTGTGSFLGTPLYASPEQVRGEAAGPQSDVYSLAATLYCLLAGRAPFEGADAVTTLARIVSDPAPPLRTLRPEILPALEWVVLRGLERDRQRRWRDLDEFREALLPFLPGRQDAAGPGMRIAAYVADWFVLLIPTNVGARLTGLWTAREPSETSGYPFQGASIAGIVTGLALWFLYFVVCERLWGGTPGKRFLRLRVRTLAGGDPPSWGRALLRCATFYALFNLGTLTVLPWLFGRDFRAAENQVAFMVGGLLVCPGLTLLGIGLLLSTARRRNGWRMLHDLASGTRVVQLPPATTGRTAGTLAAGGGDLTRPADLPERVGPYPVTGALLWGEDVRVLRGEDRALGRPVLLWLRPLGAAPLGADRRGCARPARLRWLAAGEQGDWRWDAFPAPAGRPLADVVAERGPYPWPEARQFLEQLAEELAAAEGDQTLPDSLEVAQLWVQPGGGALLLDPPLRPAEEARTPPVESAPPSTFTLGQPLRTGGEGSEEAAPAPDRALALAGQAAVLALEGWPRPRARRVRAPLPEHAARLLGRLLGEKHPYRDAEAFRAELASTHEKPAEVTRARRAAHLAVLAVALYFSLFSCCLGPVVMGTVGPTSLTPLLILSEQEDEGRRVLRGLEEAAAGDFASGILSPQPLARPAAVYRLHADLELCERLRDKINRVEGERLARLARGNQLGQTFQFGDPFSRQEAKPAEAGTDFRAEAGRWLQREDALRLETVFGVIGLVLPALGLLVAVGWAGIFRGGLTYYLLGLSLVRPDGRRAGRLRCAWRALLVWGPLTALLLAVAALELWHWSLVVPDARSPSVTAVVEWLRRTSIGVLVAYPVLAVCFPRRCLHDRLAGTYLVPR